MRAPVSLTVMLATAACAACLPVRSARAHDSLSPVGAPHTWLPGEDWVMRHWVPFDEQALIRRLDLRGRGLEAYLYDDHHALSDLALARGLDPAQLRDELVAPWRPIVDDARYELLRERTQRVLTQPHLAQHVFFHVFHDAMVAHHPHATFGLPAATVRQMRLDGLTPVDIAGRGGVSAAALRSSLLHFFALERDEGIRRRVAWPDESRRIHRRQISRLSCWMYSPRPGDDPANPYGKARFWHGPHTRAWPRSRRQRLANERRVEHLRRRLQRGCWPRPPAWSWPANGLTAP
ncbi:MAG TPA: hypothetical protein VEX67_01495 [Solirubrobacteraceae bacterium]|nr:hypothetical protein [Solirubrobacteraceae bacterium]